MNEEEIEKDFIEKAKYLSFALINTLTEKTAQEDTEMSIKISLLALAKVSASVLYRIQKFDPDETTLKLFIGTVIDSVNNLDGQALAHEEAQDIIDKLRGKQ